MERWLSVKRAALEMDVSERTIRRWLTKGLKYSKVGRIVRIHSTDLDEYMNKHRVSNKLPPDNIVDSMLNLG